jgi:hypothetical protein
MSLTVLRTLGGGPFAEVGRPRVAATSPDDRLIAVGGDLGWLQWPGNGTANTRGYRLGVYREGGEVCDWLIRSHWPVLSLAFHPELPLLAVGTGSYDGGYAFEGELLLLDPGTGKVTSALDEVREIRRVEWLDGNTLRLQVTPHDDDELDEKAHSHAYLVDVEGDGWMWSPTVSLPAGTEPMVEYPAPTTTEAPAGVERAERTRVWAVECLSDGRILAALDGLELECRRPDGEIDFEVPEGSSGRQIVVSEDESGAWVTSQAPDGSVLAEFVLLTDGQIIDYVEAAQAVTMTGAAGWVALRDTSRAVSRLLLVDPAGKVAEGPELTGFDQANHPFTIRRSTEFLVPARR